MSQLTEADVGSLPAEVPVVIVGGGPAGLFQALDLDAQGVRTLVIEPRVEIDPNRPRAKTTSCRTMTHLRRLGLASVLRKAAPLTPEYSEDVVFCTSLTGFELRRFRNAFQTTRDRYDLQPEGGQQAPQPLVELVLRHAVIRSSLSTLASGLRVVDVEWSRETGGKVRVEDETGRYTVIHCSWIIGADGSRSTVRDKLGIELQGSSAARSNLNVVFRSRSLAERVAFDPALHYWVVRDDVGGIVGRLDLETTWWAMLQGVDVSRPDLDPPAMVNALVGEPVDLEIVETDPWTARMLLAERFADGGVFLVGDAAHLNPPWGGHGFNTAIGDASNLSWKIAAMLKGWGGDGLLGSYENERRRVAAQTIHDAEANGNALAVDFAHPLLPEPGVRGDEARRQVAHDLDVKRSEFYSLGLVLGYHYAGSPIVTDEAGAAPHDPIDYHAQAFPGALLPHRWLADGRSVYDVLDEQGFTLLVSGESGLAGTAREFLDGQLAAETQDIPVRLLSLREQDLDGGTHDEAWGAHLVLVRPDQHVAWRGDSVSELEPALLRAAGRAGGG